MIFIPEGSFLLGKQPSCLYCSLYSRGRGFDPRAGQCKNQHRRVGEGFPFSLSFAAVLRSSRVEYKSLGPGPPKAECSPGVWGRAPGLLNGLVFCAVGGLGGGLAAYLAACRPSYGV